MLTFAAIVIAVILILAAPGIGLIAIFIAALVTWPVPTILVTVALVALGLLLALINAVWVGISGVANKWINSPDEQWQKTIEAAKTTGLALLMLVGAALLFAVEIFGFSLYEEGYETLGQVIAFLPFAILVGAAVWLHRKARAGQLPGYLVSITGMRNLKK